MYYVLLLVSLAFAVARFLVPVEGLSQADIFKDLAHIWVGILIGAAWFRKPTSAYGYEEKFLWWTLPIALTVVEIVAFFVRAK